jgi:hypothetical protein
MSNDLYWTWKSTVSTFWGYVHHLKETPHEHMSDSQKTELKAVEAGLLAFIASFGTDFNAACTRQNLLFLSNSWAAFVPCSDQTTEYWRARFPEWSYMITQFHAFVNERAIADMAAAHTQPHPNWYNDTASHSAPPRAVHAALLHSLLLDLKDIDNQKPREQ